MNMIDFNIKAAKVDNFMDVYASLNKHLIELGTKIESRNGPVSEELNWKVELNNPIKRCVGGWDRDINIFFLLAEALWIWGGRKDVAFLTFFNSNMSEFSDNGKTFNAPYGFRLRHYGVSSDEPIGTENQMHAIELSRYGVDQIATAIDHIASHPTSRRAVMAIWNPSLDLSDSKDIPCNDLVMLQPSNGALHMTIANRSNDLHWGLPTNVFQFSWILELMAHCLNMKVGTQTHNSKNLHIYLNNPIPEKMLLSRTETNMYDLVSESVMDLNIESKNPMERLEAIDNIVSEMLGFIEECIYSDVETDVKIEALGGSQYMMTVFRLLEVFINYKKRELSDDSRSKLLSDIMRVEEMSGTYCQDYILLAKNWVISRIKDHKLKVSLIQENLIQYPIGSL